MAAVLRSSGKSPLGPLVVRGAAICQPESCLALTCVLCLPCQLFAATNFSSYTNLHHIAGIHAAARVLPYLPVAADRARLLRRLWQAIVYNNAIQDRPPIVVPPIEPSRPWSELVTGTLKQVDVHLHELMYYASRDHHKLPEARLRQCADRALALFESGGKWKF